MSTALDFRDIHQHPPAASKAGQPLPSDPSWDAHKVYFNERERDAAAHGDEFDDFFAKQSGDENNVFVTPPFDGDDKNQAQESKEQDETLDPLGWPVDAFRSMSGRVQSFLVANNTLGAAEDDDDDGEGDDLNLLRKSDQDEKGDGTPSTAANVLSSLGLASDTQSAQQMVEGVQNLFLYGSTTSTATAPNKEPLNQDSAGMDKQERIKMYETTGADDESSVEEEGDGGEDDDDEEWEKDRDVGYVAQSASNDDNEEFDEIPIASTNERIDSTSVPEFQQVNESTVPTFKVPATTTNNKAKKKKSSSKKSVPMIRPPPAEKLQKWEEAKARPLKHLQEQEQKKK